MQTKTKKLTYKNEFHKTTVSVQARIDEDGQLSLSAGQVNKIYKTLCPYKDCKCMSSTASGKDCFGQWDEDSDGRWREVEKY